MKTTEGVEVGFAQFEINFHYPEVSGEDTIVNTVKGRGIEYQFQGIIDGEFRLTNEAVSYVLASNNFANIIMQQ